ncbi:hypothetical protein ACFB49_26860 [Sphingomonas sp. DBB INV C78]|uniref:class I SAM-dependent methyltransferase n=1 Tax=Sphingomonas sp. DBB INV C78 TaxID=3349434 RepID=UPI0036D3D0C1
MTARTAAENPKISGAGVSGLGLSIREFLREPRLVGSGFPASRYLVEKLLAPVDWSGVRLVVEFGPGTGPLTRALLAHMPRASRLVAIDVSDPFTAYLRRTIHDPRLMAVTGSAEDAAGLLKARGVGQADLIVTGIPFSTMSNIQADRIMDGSLQVLRQDGMFLAYQMRSAIAPLLHARFEYVRKSYEWRNIPPCHLYWAQREARA